MITGSENRLFALMIGVFSIVAVFFLFFYLGNILFLFFLGIVCAYLFNPLIIKLEARGYRRHRVVTGVYALFTVILILGTRVVVPMALDLILSQKAKIGEFVDILAKLPEQVEQLWLSKLPVGSEQAIAAAEGARAWVVRSLAAFPASVLEFAPKLVDLVLLPVITFFAMVEGPRWTERLIRICPNRHVEKMVSLLYQVDEVLGNYLRGLLVDCLCVAVAVWIGLTLVGVDYAWELAILAGVVNVIPYLGPVIASVVGAAVAFAQFHDISVLVRVIAVFVAVKFLDDWVFQTLIMRSAVHLHPLLLLFAILAGGQLFGFFGLVFAVPVAASFQAAAKVFADWYTAESGRKATPIAEHILRIPAL